jgi:glutathione S-transferase
MGAGEGKAVPPRKPVPQGKIRICEAGYNASPHTGRARQIIGYIAAKYPNEYESWFYFDAGDKYFKFLHDMFDNVTFPAHLKGHGTSPFIWLETAPNEIHTLIGGRADLATWVKSKFPNDKELLELAGKWTFGDTFHDKPTSAQSTADVKVETKMEEKKAEYHNYSGSKVILLGDKFPTRTHRVAWMLYELEQEFDFEEVAIGKDAGSTSEFLAKYPLLQKDPLFWGAVPAIIDGPVALTESTIIVNYLADKHKKLIPAAGTPERLKYDQLINFFNTELEAPIFSVFLHSFILPQEAQVPQVIPFEKNRINDRLHNIERLLKENGSGFIFGSSFSAADVICGYWLANLHRGQPLTEGFPTTAKYAEAMGSRKAYQQSVERLGSFL